MTSTADQLAQILDWAAILPALLTRRAPTGDTSRTGRSVPGGRPPVRLDVLHVLDTRTRVAGDDAEDRAWHDRMAGEHRQGLLPDLWQWCRLIEAEALEGCPDVPDELPEAPTLASVVAWLVKHTTRWTLAQQWASEYVADVGWWWRRLRDLVGEAGEVGVPCARCGEGLAMVHLGLWECGTGHQVTVQPVSIREAARITGTHEATLRRWLRESGAPRLSEGATSVIYDLGTIRRVIAERKLADVV